MKLAQHKLSRRMQFRGLNVSIETDEGELRHWYDPHNDEKGTTKMKFPYGYIRRTKGVDGDHVDVYVGPYKTAKDVFIIHQMKAPNFKKYDEDKCMIGFRSAAEAKAAYLSHYNSDKFFGSMTIMPFEDFKEKVLHSFELKRPHKLAEALKQGGTSLKFIQQLEKDFGEEFARRFFKETTQAAKGEVIGRPMTARIERGVLKKTPLPPPLPSEVLRQPPPLPMTVTAADKSAATPMQMLNRKFLLYPELPDVILGRETPKTRLEELAEAVLPEEEEPKPERRKTPPPHISKAVEAPETPPDEQSAEPKKKEAAMNAHLKLAYAIGGEYAITQFIKDAKLAISGQVKSVLQNVRSLMAQGRSSEAIDAAYKAVAEGQIPHEALQQVAQRGAPMEKQIWEGVRGIKDKALVDPAMKGNLELIQKGVRPGQSSSIEYLSQQPTGGAAKEVQEVLSARPAKTTWQHTPEEMKAFAEKGEAGLAEMAPATEAAGATRAPAYTPEMAGAAGEAAGKKGPGLALPLLAGGALGAGGYAMYQKSQQPKMPGYYKGASDALDKLGREGPLGPRREPLAGTIFTAPPTAEEHMGPGHESLGRPAPYGQPPPPSRVGQPYPSPQPFKGAADAQITGTSGKLLKAKTMTLKPPTSALPKTPALKSVMAKLSQTSVAQGTALPVRSPAPAPIPVKPPAPTAPTTPQDPVKAAVAKAIKEAQALGDPNFWQGGTPAEGEMAPPPTAEEAVKQLPLGTFQGMTTKVTPEGERSTSVNVTPDALAMPDIIQSIFAAEPGAKVEVKTPEQPEMGGEELVPPGMSGGGPAAPPLPA